MKEKNLKTSEISHWVKLEVLRMPLLSNFCSLSALPASMFFRLATPKYTVLLVPFGLSLWTCCLWIYLVTYEPAGYFCSYSQSPQMLSFYSLSSCSPMSFIKCSLIYMLGKLLS